MPSDPEAIDLIIETSPPGEDRITIRVTPEHAAELRALIEAEGVVTDDQIIEMSVPEIVLTLFEVVGPLSAVTAATAKSLSVWWHRNDGKQFHAKANGEEVDFTGMGHKEITKTLTTMREQRHAQWREMFPDMYPTPDETTDPESDPPAS